MSRRDPIASALFGLGCAMVIGAPLIAVAVSCAASGSQGSVQRPAATTASPAPGGSTPSPHSDTQEGGPPSSAQFPA